jgi:drug/metabolite transporter (DMT)-like permease
LATLNDPCGRACSPIQVSRLKNGARPSDSRPSASHVKPPDDVPRGILLMIGATILFAVWSAIGKWQVALYPVGEVMFLRSISSLVVCMVVMLPFTGVSVFATRRRRDHIVRGLSQAISQTFTIIAFSLMPLAGAIAINFSAPLWTVLLSIIWLKETAGPARWTALLSGFFGVLIVANPGADSLRSARCSHWAML